MPFKVEQYIDRDFLVQSTPDIKPYDPVRHHQTMVDYLKWNAENFKLPTFLERQPSFPIRIITVPQGGAPEDIRHAWVGVEIDRAWNASYALGFNVATGEPIPTRDGIRVPTFKALQALLKASPEATWYFLNRLPNEANFLLFGQGEVEVIPGNS